MLPGGGVNVRPTRKPLVAVLRFVITPIGGALGTALILPLADYLYPGDRATGIQVAMALFGAIGCVMFIICFVTTKERVQPIKEENLNIARDVKILFRNDQWRILSIYNFMMLVAVVILILLVQLFQSLGTWLARRSDKRLKK